MNENPKILVVDDENIFRTFVADTLRFTRRNYILYTASSGTEALELIAEERDIDIVLLDVMMPSPNGFEVLEALKQNPDTAEIKVIMLTGTHQVENKVKAFTSGAVDYISKPFEPDELLARIDTQIRLKQSEHSLRESEERYRVLAENASDLISKITPDGIYTYVSPACRNILGFEPRELIGQSYYALVHPDDLAEIRGMNPPLLHPSAPSVFALRFGRKNGTYVWLETSINPNKNDAELVAVARDITERKTYEAAVQRAYAELEKRIEYRTDQLTRSNYQLTQEVSERKRAEIALEKERASLALRVEDRTAELREANAELSRAARLKDEFLASMSHELRTPLNAVLGMSEALQEQVYGPLNEQQLKSLATIEESGRHLLSLINDILDLSKIEAGKLAMDIGTASVSTVCQASLRFIKQVAHKKHLKVSSEFDSAVTTIQADERRLKQILVNLLSNAVKFTPEGGQIGLTVEGNQEERIARFIVWDTGIGISDAHLPKLFQPFVQLDSKLSRRYSGTGLGLALVQRMTAIHKGEVTVESVEGEGSRFIVSLPWSPEGKPQVVRPNPVYEPDSRLASPQAIDTASRPAEILLAEDNKINIITMSQYLTRKGYRLTLAENGIEAIRQVQNKKPDLILMDIQMPDMDGLEATRRIRADDSMADVPIIALTALAMPGDRERCLEAGVDGYLSKPVNLKELISTIEACLNGNRTGCAENEK